MFECLCVIGALSFCNIHADKFMSVVWLSKAVLLSKLSSDLHMYIR